MGLSLYQRYGRVAEKALEGGLSGVRKAAILMMSLDRQTAAALMGQLPKEDIELVSLEIARLDNVTPEEQDGVVEEFYQLSAARRYLDQGGILFAQELLERSLPPDEAKRLIEQVKLSLHGTPFSFLKKTPGEQLAQFLAEEHPQTIAVVVAHLMPQKAGEVLKGLPANKQLEVTKRIANLEQTSPELVRDVERSLEVRLSALLTTEMEEVGGPPAIAEIMNHLDRSTEKAILESLEAEDPDLVEQVRKLMFLFDDIVRVDQRGMQEVLKEIQNDTLALALKGASEEIKQKFFNSMSERAGTLIRENMEFLGPVRLREVERAQQEIIDTVRRLADAGTIHLAERGTQEDMVV